SGFLEEAEVVDAAHTRVVAQELRNVSCVLHRTRHAQLQRLEGPHHEPSGHRVAHRAEDRAHRADRRDHALRTEARARDQVTMTADVLRERVEYQVRTVRERLLPERTEER